MKKNDAAFIFNYVASLDGIRCIALVVVLMLHASYGLIKGGWIGVDLFFVLSGYLITSLLQGEYVTTGKLDLTRFYARRALRLFPPVIVCIVLTNALWPYFVDQRGAERMTSALASLFYFANIVSENAMGPLRHLWSLSVEEHFYLFWPLLVSAFIFRAPRRQQAALLLGLVVAVAAFRIYVFNSHISYITSPLETSYRSTLCRVDAILLGALLAVFRVRANAQYKVNWLVTLALCSVLMGLLAAAVLFLDNTSVIWRNGGFMLTNLLCVAIIVFAIKNPTYPVLSSKLFRWVGRRSYGIYVYHYPIFLALEGYRVDHSRGNFIIITLVRFLLSFAFAEISFRFIEQPILKYKKRFAAKTKVVAVAS